MKKVFVFCIGGTGERVMKSITMLMAAGMGTNGYAVVPIIIDPHLDLNEKKNLQTLMLKYGEIQKSMLVDGKCPDGFFHSEMKQIDELDSVTNNTNKVAGEDRSYAAFLEKDNLNAESINNFLIQTLYSKDNLNSKLSVGFRGNPNVGTVVLQEMLEGASWFNFLKTQCGKDDRVFIISSIFGGTGASGYPLLERKIRNTKESEVLSKVCMGAVTVLPYYGLSDPKKSNSKIDSANFITKAKAALAYYETSVKSDLLYYVGETELKTIHENNEQKQEDTANFTELVAATALFDFLQRPCPKQTQYLTRAIEEDTENLDLSTAGSGYAPMVKNLVDFSLLKKLIEILTVEKYFPLIKSKGFDANFYNGSLAQIKDFLDEYEQWYAELSLKNRKFAPIKEIIPSNMSEIVKNGVELDAPNDSYYLLQMIRESQKTSSNNKVRDFMEYAYKAINNFTQKIK